MKQDNRCQALDDEGRQCKKKAARAKNVRLDSEMYDSKWIKAKFCQKCFDQVSSSSDSFEIGR